MCCLCDINNSTIFLTFSTCLFFIYLFNYLFIYIHQPSKTQSLPCYTEGVSLSFRQRGTPQCLQRLNLVIIFVTAMFVLLFTALLPLCRTLTVDAGAWSVLPLPLASRVLGVWHITHFNIVTELYHSEKGAQRRSWLGKVILHKCLLIVGRVTGEDDSSCTVNLILVCPAWNKLH